ncbi:MAG TPA: hypothetical protein PKA95_13260, partial [Thermomicrobiales bacterium]|nr:hypothetical protein [Thermomicrobiales bacterium]
MTAITVVDVGPRDGLQNEPVVLPPAVRAELCDRLAAAGLSRMEAASFVHPKLVPQMAGAEEVMATIRRRPGVVYAGLVLNERGYDRAIAANVDAVHYTFAVSDSFAARNQNSTVADSIALALKLAARAKEDGKRFVIPLSTAFGCPFEGPIDPGKVLDVVAQVQQGAPDEVVLCDTIGVGVPSQVRAAAITRFGVAVLTAPLHRGHRRASHSAARHPGRGCAGSRGSGRRWRISPNRWRAACRSRHGRRRRPFRQS